MLEQAGAGHVGEELEVAASGIGCEREQNHPLALIVHERLHAVKTHVRGHGDCIHTHVLEKRAGVERRGVADVAALGVGYDELVGIILADIPDSAVKCLPARPHSETLVEGCVGFIGHAVRCGGVDDGFVEGKNRILFVEKVLRDFLDISVKAYTEKRTFLF